VRARTVALVVVLVVLVATLAAAAHPVEKIPRIGLLLPGAPPDPSVEVWQRSKASRVRPEDDTRA